MRSRETEIKLKIPDLPAMRRRLRELGFRQAHRRCFEDNVLFDTPDRSLRKERRLLRLRRYGNDWVLTFKGTPEPDNLYKSRVEFESGVDRPAAIRAILESLGYIPVFRYQKYRTQFVPSDKQGGHAHREVVLDETPIGTYLELEGDRRWIDRVASNLGFGRSDYLTASYGALYLQECRAAGVAPGDMVFRAGENAKPDSLINLGPRASDRSRGVTNKSAPQAETA